MSIVHPMDPAVPKSRIPVSGPWITEKEIQYVTDAVSTAWYADAGKWHARFEKAFADHLGVRHAIALPSCTSAIHLSLAALGIGPGDEVIVPELTWIATSAPVAYVGATPVFADVDPDTWCLSAGAFEAAITPRTRAVIPVDLYGNLPDYDAMRAIAARHGIAVIEDAAEAVGGRYHGKPAGSLGDTGVFSFHGSKTLTTGEGGLLATNRDDILNRVLHLRDHGREQGDRYFFNTEVGFKYRMSAMQAALGTAQLERVDALLVRKREIFGWYREGLAGVAGLRLNAPAAGTEATYWMVTILLDPGYRWDKRRLQDALATESIDTRPFFHPLSSLPAYQRHPASRGAAERNPVAYSISPWGLNLPSALNLTRADVDRVCTVLKRLLATSPA